LFKKKDLNCGSEKQLNHHIPSLFIVFSTNRVFPFSCAKGRPVCHMDLLGIVFTSPLETLRAFATVECGLPVVTTALAVAACVLLQVVLFFPALPPSSGCRGRPGLDCTCVARAAERVHAVVDGHVASPAAFAAEHTLPAFLPRNQWDFIGGLLQQAELAPPARIPGNRWVSLRLDGCRFSRLVRRYRKDGLLEATGYSARMADIMETTTRALMDATGAAYGFTQSDEITVLIPPTTRDRATQAHHAHLFAGRPFKLCSTAAALASTVFLRELGGVDGPPSALPCFDCRAASLACESEALLLVAWRSVSCATNGVADAVHHTPFSSARRPAPRAGTTVQRLEWLHQYGLLPLPPAQAYGVLLVRTWAASEATNPKTGATVDCVRASIEQIGAGSPPLHTVCRPVLEPFLVRRAAAGVAKTCLGGGLNGAVIADAVAAVVATGADRITNPPVAVVDTVDAFGAALVDGI
jgi:hypothetical protein